MGARNPLTPVPVSASQTEVWKPRLSWHFRSFCRRGDHEPDDLWADVEEKRRQLWVALDGDRVKVAILTGVCNDRQKTFEVTHAAGEDRHLWLPMFGYLEAFARQIGCRKVRIVCRPGYEREFGAMGLRKTHITMEKRL